MHRFTRSEAERDKHHQIPQTGCCREVVQGAESRQGKHKAHINTQALRSGLTRALIKCQIAPENLMPTSENVKVWFHCDEGPDHNWQMPLQEALVEGALSCPCCEGRKVSVTNRLVTRKCNVVQRTITCSLTRPTCTPNASLRSSSSARPSLLTVRADISSIWHPTKNGSKVPEAVVAMSEGSCWLKNTEGREWEVSIRDVVEREGMPEPPPLPPEPVPPVPPPSPRVGFANSASLSPATPSSSSASSSSSQPAGTNKSTSAWTSNLSKLLGITKFFSRRRNGAKKRDQVREPQDGRKRRRSTESASGGGSDGDNT